MRAHRRSVRLRSVALLSSLALACAEPLSDDGAAERAAVTAAAQPLVTNEPSAEQVRAIFGKNARVKGCKVLPGADGISVSDDGHSIQFYFDNFAASFGAPQMSATATCWIYFDIKDVPAGATFRVTSFSYNLSGIIPPSASASMTVSYYFENEGTPAGVTIDFPSSDRAGRVVGFEERHKAISSPASPCSVKRDLVAAVQLTVFKNSALDVPYAELRLNSTSASQTDETVAKPQMELHLDWSRCPTDADKFTN